MAETKTHLEPYREITVPAVLFGVFIGLLMTTSFVYISLKLGFGLGGWGDPEFRDEDECVGIFVRHRNGDFLRARGVSDLDCLYQIILQILFGVTER
ncbi:MAG TPA: hypothetical protein EYN66_17240 [Myxococcales bacterium]|nr:hypothetical protein [Myxococcales bacterium]